MSSVLDLLTPLTRRLIEERGFSELTPPQKAAIPLVLKGLNVLIVAPTGTGKTEAAVIPVADLMLREERRPGVKLIYITPLRALNRDILERIEWWFRKLDFRVAVRHGDTSASERRFQAIHPPDVLVTTPETFQLLFLGKLLRKSLSSVKWIIVDEVHEVASSKRGTQLAVLLRRLIKLTGREPQIIGLSATVGNPSEVAEFLVGCGRDCRVVYVPVAKQIEVEVEYPEPSPGDEAEAQKLYLRPDAFARLKLIKKLVLENTATLIFTNTRPMAELLSSRFKLWDPDLPIHIHHGSLSVHSRTRAEKMLKTGRAKGIICTSSLELGIDVGHVDLVIQYNSPRQVSKLVQRVGRSGHKIGEVSRGVVVVQNTDDALEALVLKYFLSKEKIEPVQIPEKPLDVLAHELISLIIAEKRVDLIKAYNLFKETYPYRNLELQELLDLVSFLEEIGLIKNLNGTLVLKDKNYVYKYFYSNLSMIPEVKQYIVVNEEDNLPVGILDDFFVAHYCEPGVKFIIAGAPWKVKQVFEDIVYVKPEEDYTGAIPSWIGEEIPVPFEVAQEVGKIRKLAAQLAYKKLSLEEAAEFIAEKYKWRPEIVAKAVRDVYEMAVNNTPVPSHDTILVEKFKDIIVVHMHFGNRVNRTIGRYLAYKITELYGTTVYIAEKPYAVYIKSKWITAEDIAEILTKTNKKDFTKTLEKGLPESRFFKWRLTQVARRMGAIDPEAKLTHSIIEKLAAALKNTPAYQEALKETLHRDLDLNTALKIVDKIADKEIKIITTKGPTPLAQQSLIYAIESMEPAGLKDRKLLGYLIFKAKILSTPVTIACLSCGEYIEEKKAHEAEYKPCPICGSTEIVFSLKTPEQLLKDIEHYQTKPKTKKSKKLKKTAQLYKKHRVKAVYGVVAGFTLKELSQILKQQYANIDEYLKTLYINHKRKQLKQTYHH